MTSRRQFLAGIPAAAAAVGFSTTPGSSAERAAAEIAAAKARLQAQLAPSPLDAAVLCNPVPSGGVIDISKRDAFPNVALTNQRGVTLPFYEAYIEGKVVLMNFMSIRDEEHFPVTTWMAGVVAELGDRVGRDVQVYSVTRDPEHDTPARMAAFAAAYEAPEGWQFLTGSRQHCSDLTFRMYRKGHASLPGKRKVDIAFYGHGGIGIWGTMPVGIRPDDAAGRIDWVTPRPLDGRAAPRRAGPRIFDPDSPLNHNREV
ncbi:MAG: hypothetical protein CVT80_03995 [Alphaproteobacteria bacterium HGW-Alphaproteobacteria-2]|nr:MAG: hypothetical protein CVT80_03995 [Alphaproteobacteria bacterium HGW-Alphaproteobacteria-2]